MIELIKRIETNGYTYRAGGNLYFDISKFPAYGELALLNMDRRTEARTDTDENKRNIHDFILWFTKSKFENQALIWDSPWGRGYPGWHIECSAMSIKYLGEQFDIHAGGIDHIPIHHTNEIAQSEAATGKHPWVKYWIHNEFLIQDKGKMSKSAGGFLTLRTLIDEGYAPLDYRYFLLGGHYRSQLQFSYDALDGARNARTSLRDRLLALADKVPGGPVLPAEAGDGAEKQGRPSPAPDSRARSCLEAFDKALDDDLSTPRALAELWGLLRNAEIPPEDALTVVLIMDSILGLDLAKEITQHKEAVPIENKEFIAEIEALIVERSKAKKTKDFSKADGIRNTLKERGILLEDSPIGTTWRHIHTPPGSEV
jgi:cysteinyl-tRNA synthetase